jgi:hypothetical protein
MKYLLFAFTVLLLLCPSTQAQTIVSGDVTGIWTSNHNPYVVSGSVNVVDSLIIKPGVIIRFDGGGWNIRAGANAKLVARGKTDSLITFEALTTQNPGVWNAIILENSGADDTLDYCVIRSATVGVYISSGGGFVNGTITNSIIYNCAQSGIHLATGVGGETSLVTIRNCQIYQNLGNGIMAYAQGAAQVGVTVFGSTIDGNLLDGIRVQVVWYWVWDNPIAHAAVWNSTITRNSGNGVTANHVTNTGSASASIRNSVVVYNQGIGVANTNGGNIISNDVAYNCFWRNGSGNLQSITGTGFGQNGDYRNANEDSCDVNFNIYNDPLLADTARRDYRLQPLSKAIDAGTPIVAGQYVLDPDSTIPDIGAFYFHHVLGVHLISPSHNEVVFADSVQFVWSRSVPSVQKYLLQVGTDSLFSTDMIDSTITDTTKTLQGFSDGIYWWRVKAKNNLGWGPYSAQHRFQIITTDVRDYENIPSVIGLSQNYPNPFNPTTTISYQLPMQNHVTLKVFDMLGREVATLVNGVEEPGYKSINFNANGLASGMYYYRLQAGNFIETKKLILLR